MKSLPFVHLGSVEASAQHQPEVGWTDGVTVETPFEGTQNLWGAVPLKHVYRVAAIGTCACTSSMQYY